MCLVQSDWLPWQSQGCLLCRFYSTRSAHPDFQDTHGSQMLSLRVRSAHYPCFQARTRTAGGGQRGPRWEPWCALVPCLRSQRFHSSPRDKSAPAQKEQPLFAQAILLTGIALHREEACATPGSEYQCEELLFFQLFYLIWLPFPISCSQENVSCSVIYDNSGVVLRMFCFSYMYYIYHHLYVLYVTCILPPDTYIFAGGVVMCRMIRQTSGPFTDLFKSNMIPSALLSLYPSLIFCLLHIAFYFMQSIFLNSFSYLYNENP